MWLEIYLFTHLMIAADLDDPPVCCPCGCNEVSSVTCLCVYMCTTFHQLDVALPIVAVL